MKHLGSGSKAKGSKFEREVCQKLSLWVTGGEKRDVFWRSAMSGGRATVGAKSGRDHARQAGDVCAVAPEGHALTGTYYIECKFVRSLRLDRFLLGSGPLAAFWRVAAREADRYGRAPLLIAKQNGGKVLALVDESLHLLHFNEAARPIATVYVDLPKIKRVAVDVYFFDDLVRPNVRRRVSHRGINQ
jgi:hypothetical protein